MLSGVAWMRSLERVWAAALLAAVLGGCASAHRPAAPGSSAPQAIVVHDLRSIDDLAAAFDRDRDHPRLVLLLSPT
jgi:hypothetical protein